MTDTVRSADGTTIAVDRTGEGPPVVMVLGAFCDRSSGESLGALLAADYTVFAYDRRGRGDSGDSARYAVEREVEDLAAVVALTGGAPFVYGHSSGGALALEAAARGVGVAKLAVYEPPYSGRDAGPEFAAQLDELAATGRGEEASERFLALTGAPPEVIGRIKSGPGWPRMTALAHTLSHELALGNGGSPPAERFARIEVSVLALAGGASAGWAREAVTAIAEAVPGTQARVLEGQHHVPADAALVAILEAFFA